MKNKKMPKTDNINFKRKSIWWEYLEKWGKRKSISQINSPPSQLGVGTAGMTRGQNRTPNGRWSPSSEGESGHPRQALHWVLPSLGNADNLHCFIHCPVQEDWHLKGLLSCQVASVVSDSVWPHRRQPMRLPRPLDSPGKNTGVGCHFLLQCMKVKSESEVNQSCPTLSDPTDCGPPGSSIHGIFQAKVLEWGAMAFSV